MRLNDIDTTTPLDMVSLAQGLASKFTVERVGGDRVYRVGTHKGAMFCLDGSTFVGVTYEGSVPLTVHYWSNFANAINGKPADAAIDLPTKPVRSHVAAITNFILHPDDPVSFADNLEESDATVHPIKPNQGFEIPNLDSVSKSVDEYLADTTGAKSMEDQYEELKDKIRLVAGKMSHNISSLLIYGAPASGKTHTVMTTIKELGLREGVDYVVQTGSVTDASVYRTLIENIDGLVIFDDCDSVVKTENGINMMKGALDTKPVREITYARQNSFNTERLPTEQRIELVDSISRILRHTATKADILKFETYVPKKKKPAKETGKKEKFVPEPVVVDKNGRFDLPDPFEMLDREFGQSPDDMQERLVELENYFSRYMPKKIDYRGRIIFISNMDESEWDSAILTRAFSQKMAFSDDEMLDFLERIYDKISASSLVTNEMKKEVIGWVRDLHNAGRLSRPINFRFLQQAYDLRTLGNWRKMIAAL